MNKNTQHRKVAGKNSTGQGAGKGMVKARESQNGNVVVTKGFQREIEGMIEAKGVDVTTSTVLMYILTGNNTLEEAIASFYIHGSSISHLFRQFDLSKIVKDIYNHYGVQLNEKVEGVIGVADTNTYLFDLLGEKLPELYSTGRLKTRPIDDLMDPHGLLTVLMSAIQDNKANIVHQIKNLSQVQNQFSGEKSSEDAEATIEDYLNTFKKNLNKVSQMFETSDINYLYSMMKELGNSIGSTSLVAGNGGVDIEWSENMAYLLATLVEEQKDDSGKISEIYKMLKSGNHLPSPSSTVETVDQEMIKTAVKEAIKDSQSGEKERDNTHIKDAMKEVIEEIEKQKDDKEIDIDPVELMESLKEIGSIKEIKEILEEMRNNASTPTEGEDESESDIKKMTEVILSAIDRVKDGEGEEAVSKEIVLSIKELREEFLQSKNVLSQEVVEALEGVGKKLSGMPGSEPGKDVLTQQDAEHIKSDIIEAIKEGNDKMKEAFLELVEEEEDEEQKESSSPEQVAIEKSNQKIESLESEIRLLREGFYELKDILVKEITASAEIREELRNTPSLPAASEPKNGRGRKQKAQKPNKKEAAATIPETEPEEFFNDAAPADTTAGGIARESGINDELIEEIADEF